MNVKKHIPNALTCGNLLCGCIGIIEVFQEHLSNAVYLIFLACVFDFLDGFVARALKVSSPIGKDLDSLADMVTFGVLPGLIVFKLMTMLTLISYRQGAFADSVINRRMIGDCLSYAALLIPIFSALRLAKFNNDIRQSDRFIGLPTPANALFISSLPFILPGLHKWLVENQLDDLLLIYCLAGLSILLCYFLVAELPLIALKFKNYGWPDNKMRYILIISALLLLLTLNFTAIPIIIILYIILSIIENKFMREKAVQ